MENTKGNKRGRIARQGKKNPLVELKVKE